MSSLDENTCFVCNGSKGIRSPVKFDGYHFSCARCGEYQVTRHAVVSWIKKLSPEERRIVAGWIRDQNRLGSIPIIERSMERTILGTPLPDVQERLDRLLNFLYRQTVHINQYLQPGPAAIAETYSLHFGEVARMLEHLIELGLIKKSSAGPEVAVTINGLKRCDELRLTSPRSAQAFVAMWFGGQEHRAQMNKIFEDGLYRGIYLAGFKPVRVDREEHIDSIPDKIIAEIRRSQFIVADLTNNNLGVYYEVGFARGLGRPIILTCWKDHLSHVHFDLKHLNILVWENERQLARDLYRRCVAVIGEGPIEINPADIEALE